MSTTPQPSTTGRGAQFTRVVAIGGGLVFLLPGLWAFVAPESFFENAAMFPPYNEHLIRDIGVFQLGLGAALLFAAFLRDGMLAVLAGASVGAVAHVVAHVIDRDLGGNPAVDIPAFGIVAVLLIAGALARSRVPRE